MTAEEFRTRWTGHVPKVQDVTGEYAVLVPLVERPEGLCLLYEVRADTLGRQPGEVCFPGGRLEPGEDAVSCALRETWEELGIPRPAVEVVAELDWLTHQGGFVLYPVLGIVAPEAAERLRPGPAEVKETFFVPVDWLRAHPPEVYRYPLLPVGAEQFPYARVQAPPDYRWTPGQAEVPVYDGLPYPLWGLTARITRHVVQRATQGAE